LDMYHDIAILKETQDAKILIIKNFIVIFVIQL
jgi:hypothetical protein